MKNRIKMILIRRCGLQWSKLSSARFDLQGLMMVVLIISVAMLMVSCRPEMEGTISESENQPADQQDEGRLKEAKESNNVSTLTQKEFTDVNGQKISLKFIRSVDTEDGGKTLLYEDDEGNIYLFDENGKFFGKQSKQNEIVAKQTAEVLTKEQAVVRAIEHIEDTYGADAAGKLSVWEYSYSDTYKRHSLVLARVLHGKYLAEKCIMRLEADGTLKEMALQGEGDYDAFNESLLDGMDDKLVSLIEQQTGRRRNDPLEFFEINECRVVLKEGKYVLSVVVILCTKRSENSPTSQGATVVYLPLEG